MVHYFGTVPGACRLHVVKIGVISDQRVPQLRRNGANRRRDPLYELAQHALLEFNGGNFQIAWTPWAASHGQPVSNFLRKPRNILLILID